MSIRSILSSLSALSGRLGVVCRAVLSALILTGMPMMGSAMSARNSTPDETAYFEGRLARIHAPLVFSLDCCDTQMTPALVTLARPWSEVGPEIEALLRAHRWSCTARRGGTAAVREVWCTTEDGTSLDRMLIDRGLATERCNRSGNQFGTC